MLHAGHWVTSNLNSMYMTPLMAFLPLKVKVRVLFLLVGKTEWHVRLRNLWVRAANLLENTMRYRSRLNCGFWSVISFVGGKSTLKPEQLSASLHWRRYRFIRSIPNQAKSRWAQLQNLQGRRGCKTSIHVYSYLNLTADASTDDCQRLSNGSQMWWVRLRFEGVNVGLPTGNPTP